MPLRNWDDFIDRLDLPTEKQLENWNEANDYTHEGEEDYHEEYNAYLDALEHEGFIDGDYDVPLQHAVYEWGGYQECIACGDLYALGELSELGFCPQCTQELQDVEDMP